MAPHVGAHGLGRRLGVALTSFALLGAGGAAADSDRPGSSFQSPIIGEAAAAARLAPPIDPTHRRLRAEFAVYFRQVKDLVAEQWRPREVLVKISRFGQDSDEAARVSVLSVTIDRQGRVVTLAVTQGSGTFELDQEAKAAFWRAEPLPAPPEALLGADGSLHFAFAFRLDNRRPCGAKFRGPCLDTSGLTR